MIGGEILTMKYSYIQSGVQVKASQVYGAIESSCFQKKFDKISKSGVNRLTQSIYDTIDILCIECDTDVLRSKLSFHQLNNYTISVDGVKYSNPYDVHIPGGGSNNNNNLVILFDYDHDNEQILLLDIGTHRELKLSGSISISNELIWL